MRACFLLFLAACLTLSCCTSPENQQLRSVEIKEYNGTKLGSITDFVENSINGPQQVNISTYRLSVDGLVGSPQHYTYDEVLDHDSFLKVTTLDCVEGWSAKVLWQGVLVSDLVDEAKPSPDANTVIFHAYDGYTTSLPLQYIQDKKILLAYKINNVTLPQANGYPFQLVAEDKWGYKWIRWVDEIRLSNDSSYEGYWESRGYSNDGDNSLPMFG
jgi:DMSO/TMAO reductase YedYZ molybdopterin-dependent catalytic subunit